MLGFDAIGWKFLLVYCCWIAVEALLIFWLWPETSGRTLEELAFRKASSISNCVVVLTLLQCSRTRICLTRQRWPFIKQLTSTTRRTWTKNLLCLRLRKSDPRTSDPPVHEVVEERHNAPTRSLYKEESGIWQIKYHSIQHWEAHLVVPSLIMVNSHAMFYY